MRIESSGEYSYRKDLVDDVGDVFGENARSKAIEAACHFALDMLGDPSISGDAGALGRAVEHDDMTPDLAELLTTEYATVRVEIEETREIET